MGDEYVIEVRALIKQFGYKKVLNEVNLSLKRGECLALFGPNGAGKTTLIWILSSLMRPTSGAVLVAGYDAKSEGEDLRRTIGVISHNTFLYDNLTAFENLKFYGRMYDVKDLKGRIEEVLELVGLKERMHERVQTFSRGMQQRLSIARAILHEPAILLLDEPYAGLDQNGMEAFKGILEGFREGGKTTIMTSHDLQRGLEMCSQVAILHSGVIVYSEEITSTLTGEFPNIYSHYTKAGGLGDRRSWI
ncbi:MAG: heme ABC exporter ATP-binding protein CcmA [Thermodesulfobacteriota bacterium]